MSYKKKVVIGLIVIVFVVGFLLSNIYKSSPGFVSNIQEFYANKPTCYGIDILLNKKATHTDSAGVSLCIGYLKR